MFSIKPVSYERRVVVYIDLLGWRRKIEIAGSDPQAVGQLRAVVLLFSMLQRMHFDARDVGAELTAFSDNVVISFPFADDIVPRFLEGLGSVQLGAALCGFWVRGAVTIGDLVHDNMVVFGPALNRAYELESRRAKFPRIILDPHCPDLVNTREHFVQHDGDFWIVDPFTVEFVRSAGDRMAPGSISSSYSKLAGSGDLPTDLILSPESLLMFLHHHLTAEISKLCCTGAREKLDWLLGRITARLNLAN